MFIQELSGHLRHFTIFNEVSAHLFSDAVDIVNVQLVALVVFVQGAVTVGAVLDELRQLDHIVQLAKLEHRPWLVDCAVCHEEIEVDVLGVDLGDIPQE